MAKLTTEGKNKRSSIEGIESTGKTQKPKTFEKKSEKSLKNTKKSGKKI